MFTFKRVYLLPKLSDVFTLPKLDIDQLWNIVSSRQNYAGKLMAEWTVEHMTFIFQICVAYLLIVFGGQWAMKHRQPFELRILLAFWNAFLAISSIFEVSQTLPELYNIIQTHGFTASYCKLNNYENGTIGFATFVFVFSKIPELFDTVFLVLRKRQVVFLHWFHHLLTLLYSFWSLAFFAAFNRWAIAMNCFIHSTLYSYYFLRSLKIHVPGLIAKTITALQILQFIADLAILAASYNLVYINKVQCDFDVDVFKIGTIMNSFYLILFINFFLKSYIIGGGKAKYRAKTVDSKKAQ
uniref:Elongation of very long chain fatty acids protein n=1 Tax=Syphacia muris TaxID=451379 RepID=A0A0N5AXM5_9BILA